MPHTSTAPIIFAGPSLRTADKETYPKYIFMPPVAEGDVLWATSQRPRAIGIVDGFFETCASVKHKEILWALSQGVHVFGAASMGALRAAELETFGMIGVGEIFQSYSQGLLDDDEVAVVHGPSELGYPPLNKPMINVRATISAAVLASVLTVVDAERILSASKAMFYKSRTWRTILDAAGFDDLMRTNFLVWLECNEVDQKRRDAILMMDRLHTFLSANTSPFSSNFDIEMTSYLKGAIAFMTSSSPAGE